MQFHAAIRADTEAALALDPPAKFNFRSSQGAPAAQGHRIHKEDIPGRCQKLTTVPSCSQPPPATEVVWSGKSSHRCGRRKGQTSGCAPGPGWRWGQGEDRHLFVIGSSCTCPKTLSGDLPLPGPLGDLDISCIDALPLCSDSKTSASSSPVARSLTLQLLLEPMLRNSLER